MMMLLWLRMVCLEDLMMLLMTKGSSPMTMTVAMTMNMTISMSVATANTREARGSREHVRKLMRYRDFPCATQGAVHAQRRSWSAIRIDRAHDRMIAIILVVGVFI